MEITLILLLILIAISSYVGFRDPRYHDKYIFDVDRILIDKQYYRLISSAFLHGDWFHLGFNLLAIYSFGEYCMLLFGQWNFLILFFASVLGGSILSLYVHRNHSDYRSLGASGGGFGVMFACIVIDPFSEINFLFVPAGIPAWIIGCMLIAISIIGTKRNVDNIGHDAHLGGAITGMLLTLAFLPKYMTQHPWTILLLGTPSIAFVIFIIKNPTYLMYDSFSVKSYMPNGISKKQTLSKEEELNQLLDKIHRKGFQKLSKKEKERLEQLSNH